LLAAEDGQALFKAKCAMCHGADAAGKTPMGQKLQIKDLRAPEIQKQSDAELSQAIAKGKGKMPPQESRLTKDQLAAVVAYIRGLGKK
jgi:mono/diheme cytochrome c family protein